MEGGTTEETKKFTLLKIFQKNFEKSVDNPKPMCYNNYSERGKCKAEKVRPTRVRKTQPDDLHRAESCYAVYKCEPSEVVLATLGSLERGRQDESVTFLKNFFKKGIDNRENP